MNKNAMDSIIADTAVYSGGGQLSRVSETCGNHWCFDTWPTNGLNSE